MQCSAVQCSAVQCSAAQCNAMQCNADPEYTVDTVQGKLVRKLLRRYEALFKDSEDYSSLNITKVLATEPLRV